MNSMKTFKELNETVIDEGAIKEEDMGQDMQDMYNNVTRMIRGSGIGTPDGIIQSAGHNIIFVFKVKKTITFSKFTLEAIMKQTGKRLVDITVTGNGKLNIVVKGV